MPATLEFFALPAIDDLVNATARLAVACLFGGLLGLERESVGKPAGFRTHMLESARSDAPDLERAVRPDDCGRTGDQAPAHDQAIGAHHSS